MKIPFHPYLEKFTIKLENEKFRQNEGFHKILFIYPLKDVSKAMKIEEIYMR